MAATKPQRRAAIASLASGSTHQEAADAAGVAVRTVRRWLKNPAFLRQLDFLRDTAIREAHTKLVNHMTGAIAKLADLMSAADTDSTKLGAAKAMLDNVLKIGDAVELRTRLSTLESKIDQTEQRQERR